MSERSQKFEAEFDETLVWMQIWMSIKLVNGCGCEKNILDSYEVSIKSSSFSKFRLIFLLSSRNLAQKTLNLSREKSEMSLMMISVRCVRQVCFASRFRQTEKYNKDNKSLKTNNYSSFQFPALKLIPYFCAVEWKNIKNSWIPRRAMMLRSPQRTKANVWKSLVSPSSAKTNPQFYTVIYMSLLFCTL